MSAQNIAENTARAHLYDETSKTCRLQNSPIPNYHEIEGD